MEFKPTEKLGKFMNASLHIADGEKTLVSAPLQPTESSAEKIRVSFTTHPDFVASSRLEILASHGGLSMTVYYLNMKDFINAMEPPHTTRDFALALEPVSPQIRAGTVPVFRLTLTNISDHTCRILNASRRRWDLQSSYYALVLWKDGQELPRAISDPLPVTPADWLEVAPGETRTFLFNRFPQDLKSLRPGSSKPASASGATLTHRAPTLTTRPGWCSRSLNDEVRSQGNCESLDSSSNRRSARESSRLTPG